MNEKPTLNKRTVMLTPELIHTISMEGAANSREFSAELRELLKDGLRHRGGKRPQKSDD